MQAVSHDPSDEIVDWKVGNHISIFENALYLSYSNLEFK